MHHFSRSENLRNPADTSLLMCYGPTLPPDCSRTAIGSCLRSTSDMHENNYLAAATARPLAWSLLSAVTSGINGLLSFSSPKMARTSCLEFGSPSSATNSCIRFVRASNTNKGLWPSSIAAIKTRCAPIFVVLLEVRAGLEACYASEGRCSPHCMSGCNFKT